MVERSQKNTVTGERKKNEYFGTVPKSLYTRASMVEKSLFIFHRIKPMVDQRRRKRKIKGQAVKISFNVRLDVDRFHLEKSSSSFRSRSYIAENVFANPLREHRLLLPVEAK